MSLLPLPLLAAPLLLAVAALALLRPGARPGALPRLAEAAALATLALAVAGIAQVAVAGPAVLAVDRGTGILSFRLDAVGATMAALVAFVGWIVVRYSRSYLDGEAREGSFHGLMLAALAAVLLLVQAGSLVLMLLVFVTIGVVLRRLLMFYPGRPEARRAATKFALVWHGGDFLLALAAGLFWFAFGTTDLSGLARAAGMDMPPAAQIAVALVVLAAALKTAAFPLHGWLTEVMEAPTPVSALLHAGIVNAGGVLLIRLAEPVQASPGAMAALVMLGGYTAPVSARR
jgi:NAD(P)H-quinone oxidoreductase subunit 5